MVTRNPIEKFVDRLLLLYLINNAREVGIVEGITKIQKLVFLSEWAMLDGRQKGFNYNFIKLIHGPYSEELQRQDIKRLVLWGVLEGLSLLPTEKGELILEDFQSLFDRNRIFIQQIEETNQEFAIIRLRRLLPKVYRMRHPYIPRRTIGDVKIGTPLLYRIERHKAVEVFNITSGEIATLEIYFDSKAFESLIEASKDREPTLAYDEVF